MRGAGRWRRAAIAQGAPRPADAARSTRAPRGVRSTRATLAARSTRATLDRFVAAAPAPQRGGLKLLIALARRRRGAALLTRLPAAEQIAHATLSMVRYDDPRTAAALGWEPAAVIARGNELRERRG